MTARAKPEPGVGIFWLFGGKLILDTTPLSHAEAYTAPFEKTLLKSKGLLYLTAYVLTHADAKKIHGQARTGVDNALAGLASMVSDKVWSPSDLHEKLHKFEKDHERLYKLLMHKLAGC